jgi:secondary thiamine-phosphate synthase enzyme
MMDIETKSISLSTKGFTDIIDITPDIQSLLSKSGFSEGQALVFMPGSTAGLTTIEYEDGLKRDLKEFFEKWIPIDERYYHNERWHDGNGYAHVRAAMLKPSMIIPFRNGKLQLGTWQQVILVDFDNRPRRREVVVQLSGKKH